MKLVCPQCGYNKELDEAAVPAEMVYATCPQCRTRFRFRDEESSFVLEEETPGDSVPGDQAVEAVQDMTSAPSAATDADTAKVRSVRFAARDTQPSDGAYPHMDTAFSGTYTEGTESSGAANPWQQRTQIGMLAAFIATVRAVLFAPASFFREVGSEWKGSGIIPFYLCCSVGGFLVLQLWSWAYGAFLSDVLSQEAMRVLGGEFMGWFMVGTTSVALVVLSPVLLFITAGVIHGCLRIVGVGKGRFGTTMLICGFSTGVNVLYMVPFIGQYLAMLWGLFVILVGIKHAHGTSITRAFISLLLPVVFVVILVVASSMMVSA